MPLNANTKQNSWPNLIEKEFDYAMPFESLT